MSIYLNYAYKLLFTEYDLEEVTSESGINFRVAVQIL